MEGLVRVELVAGAALPRVRAEVELGGAGVIGSGLGSVLAEIEIKRRHLACGVDGCRDAEGCRFGLMLRVRRAGKRQQRSKGKAAEKSRASLLGRASAGSPD